MLARLSTSLIALARARFGGRSNRFTREAQRALVGRKVLVTGATNGLGEAIATLLYAHGATVLVHGRSGRTVRAAIARIESVASGDRIPILAAGARSQPAEVRGYASDLTDRRALADLIARIGQEHERLDALINNAAVGHVAERQLGKDGVELLWSTNVLAPWQLATGLAPQLAASPDARVINVVSGLLHDLGSDDQLTDGYDAVHAYARSKQALVGLSISLAERFRAQGIAVNAVDPGVVQTRMSAGFPFPLEGLSPSAAAEIFGRFVADARMIGVSGKLFHRGREGVVPPQLDEAAFRDALVDRVEHRIATSLGRPGRP